jgi:hypothetical protein
MRVCGTAHRIDADRRDETLRGATPGPQAGDIKVIQTAMEALMSGTLINLII